MSTNTKYHVNPSNGDTGKCRASVKPCPFGGETGNENHYNTIHEAQEASETLLSNTYGNYANKSATANSEDQSASPMNISDFEVKDILSVVKDFPLKKMDANLLSSAILAEVHDADEDDKATITHAINVSTVLHAGQTRANRGNLPRTPYIEHPLRNTLRLIRWGVKDKDIIVASILHDSVEDGSQKFTEDFMGRDDLSEDQSRELLTSYISQQYGDGAADIVTGVSNPHIENDTRTKTEKHRDYRGHVLESIDKDDRVFMVKLADFVDNASGLHHNYVEPNRARVGLMAKKYQPLIRPFIKKLETMKEQNPDIMDEKSFDSIIQQMHTTENRLNKMMKEQGHEKYPVDQ